jgi:acyl carrier protein
MQSLENEVRSFIVDNFLFGEDDRSLKNGDSLLQNGLIDSTGVLELVAFIQQAFEVVVQDDEIVPDNLDSIEKIAAFVRRKDPQMAPSSGQST